MVTEGRPAAAPRRGLVRLSMFDRTVRQVAEYAELWRIRNVAALSAEGPLWVVLGDSTAQGVGADSMSTGYVGQLRVLLEARDGVPWQVVNLSRSGARTREVVDVQLPALLQLGVRPDLVTALIGGNDILHTRSAQWRRDVSDLVATVPDGTVLATVTRGMRERKVAPVNAHILAAAAGRGLLVADLWARTGPPYRGKYADLLHPNERGYRDYTAALAEAIGLPRP